MSFESLQLLQLSSLDVIFARKLRFRVNDYASVAQLSADAGWQPTNTHTDTAHFHYERTRAINSLSYSYARHNIMNSTYLLQLQPPIQPPIYSFHSSRFNILDVLFIYLYVNKNPSLLNVTINPRKNSLLYEIFFDFYL